MWDIWTTLDTQFQKQITTTTEHAKITYAYYTILHEGDQHIDFPHRSPGHTTAYNCKTAFSLHVVESASDDYNF